MLPALQTFVRLTSSDFFIEIQEVLLFVRRRYDDFNRPTVVFLHDSLGCVELWRDFPEKLCEAINCNIVVYDRQGYGRSASLPTHLRNNDYLENEAYVLHDLLEALDLKNVILFGHSDGGSIALVAAAKYPFMCLAVIVEAAHIFVENVTLKGIRAAVHAYATTNLKARLEKYHGDKTETIFKAWTDTWLGQEFQSWNIESFLPSIVCPVLFIQGDRDEYGSVIQMEGVAQKSGGSVDTFLIPNTHHTPHKEAAMAVIEKVSEFVRRLEIDRIA
ncbi:MAG TPA: alpha/beta hydrolase [Chryseosolibacter sp.]|nr:alpha/beta hydrolase [Chryseosolibacter sp.]